MQLFVLFFFLVPCFVAQTYDYVQVFDTDTCDSDSTKLIVTPVNGSCTEIETCTENALFGGYILAGCNVAEGNLPAPPASPRTELQFDNGI